MSPKSLLKIPTAITLSFLILLMPDAYSEAESGQEAQTVLHMLDYLSVDYGGSVLLGRVVNQGEYQEQAEFAAQSVKLLASLPEHPLRATLVEDAQKLAHRIDGRAPAEEISTAAQQLRKKIISAYRVPVSPRQVPDSQRAVVLYQQLCVKCHGVDGHGDGPEGGMLDPKPANFHDVVRMNQRSVYGLYNTISLGVTGTGMAAFSHLSDEERWDLAFLVSNFRSQPERLDLGRKNWENRNFQGAVPNLLSLTTLTANEIGTRYGDNTKSVYTYLRSEPQALMAMRHATLIFSADQLDRALARYRAGDQAEAKRLAIAAYLEGFEPMELSLTSLDTQLRLDIEQEMMAIRQLIYTKAPDEALAIKIEQAKSMLGQADELLREGKLTITGAFTSSLLVLLREGLEAILLLSAVIAFVVKSGQRNALVYIHAGWGGALLLGILTWVVASWLINISGAEREITSGIAALLASAMLIYVGFWLHNMAHARAWQNFLKNKMGNALEKKTLWAFALISFFAVYREIFETLLFYQALWAQTTEGTRSALWSGMLTAIVTLLAIGWGLFRFGIKLPLGPFFAGTTILLAILAVIFAGQGVASLQIAGIVASSPVNFVLLPMLGVHPTIQTLTAQMTAIGILILCYYFPVWRKRRNQIGNPTTPQA
ncbi:MAG: FTR1 family protein [Gallionella sp.]